jgi:hypothetical protein
MKTFHEDYIFQLRRSTGGGVQNALNNEEALRKRDVRLTRIAIFIVGIFITCHLPRFIPNIGEMFMQNLPEVKFILVLKKHKPKEKKQVNRIILVPKDVLVIVYPNCWAMNCSIFSI